MTSVAPAPPRIGSPEPALAPHVVASAATMRTFARQSFAVAAVELHKLARDPTELGARAIQPVLWLLVFGQVFTRTHAIPTGSLPYIDFMTPGVLAQSVLFSAIFFGISVIWERDLGILHKMLVTPAYRSALVVGKAISAGFRGLVQGAIIYLLALLLSVHLRLDPASILRAAAAVVLGSALFSTFSLVVACAVKTRERFMGIGQVLTMPLFFASNAIYPLAMMPPWLRAIARINPLTYLVDALRALMLPGISSAALGLDFGVQLAALIVLVWIAARLYPGIVR